MFWTSAMEPLPPFSSGIYSPHHRNSSSQEIPSSLNMTKVCIEQRVQQMVQVFERPEQCANTDSLQNQTPRSHRTQKTAQVIRSRSSKRPPATIVDTTSSLHPQHRLILWKKSPETPASRERREMHKPNSLKPRSASRATDINKNTIGMSQGGGLCTYAAIAMGRSR
ncbi:uncharacterized protein M421DRAFT_198886 [Didymella exigua CBS 183.55]|uniref:Uncharacterized protein n=1 Tax=Didymella exigua CBS 183.55 TaxID=1150837 RepID=A0A6A5S059_9PLEO|nr:uncharacterized protein M421DRAFT_198886 [Didymella exigua CBS 183.55]KAF1933502.1 hypothetical protein M421DRAFT_198886 [Didymella exigua CBS 183.55]